jgi:hypothetical protein
MTFTFDERTVSDLHKDARGYRPISSWWSLWSESSDEEKQEIWDSLIKESADEVARERSMQAAALEIFRSRIAETIALGAGDEKTAIKWIVQAEGLTAHDMWYGPSFLCFHFGLSYSEAASFPFLEVIAEICAEEQEEEEDA